MTPLAQVSSSLSLWFSLKRPTQSKNRKNSVSVQEAEEGSQPHGKHVKKLHLDMAQKDWSWSRKALALEVDDWVSISSFANNWDTESHHCHLGDSVFSWINNEGAGANQLSMRPCWLRHSNHRVKKSIISTTSDKDSDLRSFTYSLCHAGQVIWTLWASVYSSVEGA